MAFSTTLIGSSGVERRAYNIDWSVGHAASNRPEDVMLVQALFRILYYELMGFNSDFEPPPGEAGVIVVDGIKGPATQRHIVHFQNQVRTRGFKVTLDGVFDPYRAPGALSTISRTRYALDLLNNGTANLCRDNGVDYYDRLPYREDMPLRLRSALQTFKKTADKYR